MLVVQEKSGYFKDKARLQGSLSTLKEHDDKRQLTILAGIDLPLGGTGRPDILGLYYAKIGIGTPAKSYITFNSTQGVISCGLTVSSANSVQNEAILVSS